MTSLLDLRLLLLLRIAQEVQEQIMTCKGSGARYLQSPH